MKPVAGKPRLGPCVGNMRHFIAIGLNYADHAAEAGMPIPKEPIIFNKAPTSHLRPERRHHDPEGLDQARLRSRDRHRDRQARALSLQEERARRGRRLFPSATTCRSATSRSSAGGQWNKGKGCETFGPLGPWFVTKDEIKDPQKLDMWLDVNGEKRQRGNTKTMIFGIEHIVWYCSQFFVMEPGDIIITGTPPGVGLGMKPDAEVPESRRRRHARHRGARRAATEDRAGQILSKPRRRSSRQK